jgi:DsbC/DsbD-like thiol-disulfide interchange protein
MNARALSLLFAAAAIAAIAICAPSARAQNGAMPNGASVVKPHAYVSLDAVPTGKTFEVAIVADIQSGYHMNSNKPSEDYLIPTTVALTPPSGFRLLSTTYPDGKLLSFTFSKDKLSVYSGSVTVRIKLAADASAAPGDATLPFLLHFQACNDTACLPPAKIQIPVTVKIAAAGAASHATHPEIFK